MDALGLLYNDPTDETDVMYCGAFTGGKADPDNEGQSIEVLCGDDGALCDECDDPRIHRRTKEALIHRRCWFSLKIGDNGPVPISGFTIEPGETWHVDPAGGPGTLGGFVQGVSTGMKSDPGPQYRTAAQQHDLYKKYKAKYIDL